MRVYFFITSFIVVFASCNSAAKKEKATPVLRISDTLKKAGSVYLTSDEKNNPVISWCETDSNEKKFFGLAFWDTATEKFSATIPVPVEQSVVFHEEGMPKVAVKGNGDIVVVYETSSPTQKNTWAGSVWYIQSFDKGKTWTTPRNVHADTSMEGSHSFAAVTTLGDGEIGACWLDHSFDYKKGGRPVKFAATDGKHGFANEILVDSIACECCRLAIAAVDNKINIVYRDIVNDSVRDISICTSINNGQSFGKPISFSRDNWNINGCPHNGPGLANTPETNYAVWFTGGSASGVYYGELGNDHIIKLKRKISGNGNNIQIGLLADGSRIVVHNENGREGDSLYSRVLIKKIRDGKMYSMDVSSGQAHASYPVVRTLNGNNIVVAWADQQQVYYRLMNSDNIHKEVMDAAYTFDKKLPVDTSRRLTMNTDLVCGMRMGAGVEDTTVVAGKLIGFCSKSCKEKYLADPKKYPGRIN